MAFAPDGRSVLIGTGSDGRGGSFSLGHRHSGQAGRTVHPRRWRHGRRRQPRRNDGADRELGRDRRSGSGRRTDRPALSLRHRFGIEHAFFSPDGATVLTICKRDMSAYLWEAATGRRIGTSLWHSDVMDCVAISPDGRMAVSAGADMTARVWEIGRGRSRPLDRVEGRNKPVDLGPKDGPGLPPYYMYNTIVYSPDRKTVLASDGGRIDACGKPRPASRSGLRYATAGACGRWHSARMGRGSPRRATTFRPD